MNGTYLNAVISAKAVIQRLGLFPAHLQLLDSRFRGNDEILPPAFKQVSFGTGMNGTYLNAVIPAKAGIQRLGLFPAHLKLLDSRFRGDGEILPPAFKQVLFGTGIIRLSANNRAPRNL